MVHSRVAPVPSRDGKGFGDAWSLRPEASTARRGRSTKAVRPWVTRWKPIPRGDPHALRRPFFPQGPTTTLRFTPVAQGDFPASWIALGEAALAVAGLFQERRAADDTKPDELETLRKETLICIQALYDLPVTPEFRNAFLSKLTPIFIPDDTGPAA